MKNLLLKWREYVNKTGKKWDKLAPTEEEAIEFAHANINPEPERMITPTHFSYEYYLAHYGESVNTRMRQDRADNEDMEAIKMVASHSNKVDIVLYRGVCEAVYQQMRENAKGMDADLYEKAFLQCSLVKGNEIHGKYRLRIYVPAGTECVYLGNVNDEQYYYEVVIQAGRKLRIVGIDDTYINCVLC